jgi:antiviral helicase SKI2
MKAKFYGNLESGEYYECERIGLEYIDKVYNYSFKQDLAVLSLSQARNLAERLSTYLSKNKVVEMNPTKKAAGWITQRNMESFEKTGAMKCQYWNEHFERSQTNRENKISLDKVNAVLSKHNIEFMQDYQNKLKLLRVLNFIDDKNCLLIKGKVAREISGGRIILLTEMLFSGKLRDLEPEEFVAIVSTLVSEEKVDKDLYVTLSEKYDEVQTILYQRAKEVFQLELDCGVYLQGTYEDMLHFGLAPVIYYWVQGKSFSYIANLTTIHEGSIIRGIMRVEYILREVKNAAGIMGDSKLKEMCSIAQDKIKRDIIFTPSLYIQ